MGLWLGTWEGTLKKETEVWLRVYVREAFPEGNRSGNLVLLPEEIAEQEQERANLAEEERDRERERANLAETLAEEERRKNKALRDRLQELGIDPDTVS